MEQEAETNKKYGSKATKQDLYVILKIKIEHFQKLTKKQQKQ